MALLPAAVNTTELPVMLALTAMAPLVPVACRERTPLAKIGVDTVILPAAEGIMSVKVLPPDEPAIFTAVLSVRKTPPLPEGPLAVKLAVLRAMLEPLVPIEPNDELKT